MPDTTYQPPASQLAAVARCRVDRPRRSYVTRPRLDDSFAVVEVWERWHDDWEPVQLFQGRDATRLDARARRLAARLAWEHDHH